MKIGLNIVGITHDDGRHTNWQKSNIKDNIINILNKKYEVKTYLTTYFSDKNTKKIIKHYSPINVNILDWENSHQLLTYIESLKSLLNEDLDIIISTRFDIFFNQTFDELNIDFSKFNFLCKELDHWTDYKFTNDNFYIFPKQYLEEVINSIDEMYQIPPRKHCSDMHGLYNFISSKINPNNIHFISEDHMYSTENKFYTLTRFLS
jgi:hypothetical protein